MISLPYNSPEEEIHHPLFSEKNIRVYLKRDDLIHPFISGNKWRKLKYLLQKANLANKNHLVTFGGVWSNHLIATACAAAKSGLKSTGIVRGEPINTDSLALCRLFGMKLIFADRERYRDKQRLFNLYFQDDPDALFINEGGYSEEAAKGCAELVEELDQDYDHIFCACGTGATAAGIINGLRQQHSSSCLHAITVLKGDFLKDEIDRLLLAPSDFSFHSDYHFGGYAKTTPALINFIADFASHTGILIDPVYTGKMMFALFDIARKDLFLPGSKILAIHTGGLFGLLGMKDKF
ncbi:1-aminocyclopropane-1-carboxylate deaminase/D-cysteine desulfhydrase [Paradesertivirga mongoliensis]|uniref:1-aminocyclopropane-1-carboxylate deaminase/D-cysteine desulfhydrase n=1 Tax=Paradesertivirga mongoliensis TaxID=2100740 RepID=A0ABW4ZMT5_9SPHI|nr:pyridoxal-phosphate dependent enzyme [Pedobacter mongoliensis]